MLSIDTLMNPRVVTANPQDPVSEVAQRMNQASIGAVVLVEGEEFVGIFSERDLLTRVVAEGRDPASTDVGSVATRKVVTVSPRASLRECVEALRSHGVRHLPVVDGRRLVGIIAARDFFEAVAEGLERFIERARYDEQLRENLDPFDHLGGSYGR